MKLLTIALALALPAFAEDAPQVSRVVELRLINGSMYRAMIAAIGRDKVAIASDPEGHNLALRGPKEDVEAVERFLKKMDEPQVRRNVELTIYMLLGTNTTDSAAKLPQELTSVATQLRSVFPFKEYRLIETTILRARDASGAEASGVFPEANPHGTPAVYQTKFSKLTVSGEGATQNVRIDNFKFGGRLPVTVNAKGDIVYIETGMSTDVDLRAGQRVVVGKAAGGNAKDSLFIVLNAKIVD